jgi:hypothetical protein
MGTSCRIVDATLKLEKMTGVSLGEVAALHAEGWPDV